MYISQLISHCYCNASLPLTSTSYQCIHTNYSYIASYMHALQSLQILYTKGLRHERRKNATKG